MLWLLVCPQRLFILHTFGQMDVWSRERISIHHGKESKKVYLNCTVVCTNDYLKGSVTRSFASGFFHESVSPQPQSILLGPFQIFSKIHGGVESQGAPPVSTTPAANFATSFASVVDTGGKFATGVRRCQQHRWQKMGTISGCWDFKVNLKAKRYL